MTASQQDRWVCPVCEQRFLYLSELVDHVEARHPADNVTVLEPARRTTDPVDEEDTAGSRHEPDAGTEDLEAAAEGAVRAEEGGGLEPFGDFRAAAQAVMDQVTRGADREVGELLLRLLSTVLDAEARVEQVLEEGGDPSAEGDRSIDPGSGLENHRAWMDALAAEEDRCRRHGMRASVVLLRFGSRDDGAARRAASVLAGQTRAHDKIARLREDALGVLAVHCSEADASVLAERVLEAMRMERIPARTAVGARGHRLDLYGAWEEAERRLGGPPPSGSASG